MTPETNYRYDVFISYSSHDSEWVWNELLPRLESAGLRVCIDKRDFEIGTPSLVNIEQAVDSSRHTLLVLTPSWVQSEWTDYEGLLVGTADPSGRHRKPIPLLLKDCELPSHISMLTWADLRDPRAASEQFERLITQLQSFNLAQAQANEISGEKTRSAIAVHSLSAICYYQEWWESDIARGRWPSPPFESMIPPGSCRRFFVVLEFTVTNLHSTDVTVGPFRIDGWMFEDHWTPPMYSPKRDYRVYDLYTRQLTRLDSHSRVMPKGVLGLRVEVFEDTSGPGWESSKSRYWLDLPTEYTIEFNCDPSGLQTCKIALSHIKVNDLLHYPPVRRWSNLLGEYQPGSGGAPFPQGLGEE